MATYGTNLAEAMLMAKDAFKCYLENVVKSGEIGIILYLENVKNIGKNLNNLIILKKAGIRVVQIAWDKNNDKGNSYKSWVNHIKHGIKAVGADYLGFGSDFGGMLGYVPEDLANV